MIDSSKLNNLAFATNFQFYSITLLNGSYWIPSNPGVIQSIVAGTGKIPAVESTFVDMLILCNPLVNLKFVSATNSCTSK